LHTFDEFSVLESLPQNGGFKALNLKLEVFAALLAFLMPELFYVY